MRVFAQQDFQTILGLNTELINNIIDTPVLIYKLVINKSKPNIYGEATKKVYYTPVLVPCIFSRVNTVSVEKVGTIDIEQQSQFAFLRQQLINQNIYPERGDVIEYDNSYYEIENAIEVQLFAGQVAYNLQVLCDTHLMRTEPTQLQRPIV